MPRFNDRCSRHITVPLRRKIKIRANAEATTVTTQTCPVTGRELETIHMTKTEDGYWVDGEVYRACAHELRQGLVTVKECIDYQKQLKLWDNLVTRFILHIRKREYLQENSMDIITSQERIYAESIFKVWAKTMNRWQHMEFMQYILMAEGPMVQGIVLKEQIEPEKYKKQVEREYNELRHKYLHGRSYLQPRPYQKPMIKIH